MARRPAAARKAAEGRLTAIYALIGADDEIRYIGKSRKPDIRFQGHISAARKGWKAKDKWILQEHLNGALRYEILEWTEEWPERERFWIADGRAKGWALFNIEDGGYSMSHIHTLEYKTARIVEKCRRSYFGLLPLANELKKEDDPRYDRLILVMGKILFRGATALIKAYGVGHALAWLDQIGAS